mmetsp:Transcript_21521/g.36216  ORF Transcript_21521/g.36216 Transcript_21521/m.36216 type:complete len:211 (+) Transcript_21521:26-658(+)
MESRRFKIGKREEEEIIAEKGRCHNVSTEYIVSIFDKLKNHHVKIETIISHCEVIDANRDGIIHADDLIDVISDLLPRRTISRREFHYLIEALGKGSDHGRGHKHNIRYMKLEKIYDNIVYKSQESAREQWHEDAYDEEFHGPQGSIGDYLNKAACPSEIQNYKTLIACLERYERETGLLISTNEKGFRIPLGPDLKATIAFDAFPQSNP